MKIFLYSILSILVIGLALSCEKDTQDCYEPQNVTLRSHFIVAIDTVVVVDSSNPNLPPITKDTILIRDTLLNFPRATSLSTSSTNFDIVGSQSDIFFFLNPDTNKLSYRIQADSTLGSPLADTITFYYTSNLHFISNTCGYTYYYSIDSIQYTKHIYDTAIVMTPAVTNEASKLNVYLGFVRQ